MLTHLQRKVVEIIRFYRKFWKYHFIGLSFGGALFMLSVTYREEVAYLMLGTFLIIFLLIINEYIVKPAIKWWRTK